MKNDKNITNRVEVLVSRIIEDADTFNENELSSNSLGYSYNISKEDGDDWYILVCPYEQSYLYEGWWRGSKLEPIENAIKEAIRGAMILED